MPFLFFTFKIIAPLAEISPQEGRLYLENFQSYFAKINAL